VARSDDASALRGIGYRSQLRLWLVEPDEALRDLYLALVEPDAEVLDVDAFATRLRRGARPDALLIDLDAVLAHVTPLPMLDGLLRLVISTATLPADVPSSFASRPGVRILRKPFEVGVLEHVLAWLRGESDADAWAADPNQSLQQIGTPPGRTAAEQ
jgi:hypothetical protein